MREVGFTWTDIKEIEYLKNKDVRRRIRMRLTFDRKKHEHEDSDIVVKYFRAMADIRDKT